MGTQHEIAYDRGCEFREISWTDGCSFFNQTNPLLSKAIHSVKPDSTHTFLKVSYKFGDPIILKSGAYLPTQNGKGISFNDESLPKEFREKFGFDPKLSNPVGIILNKNCERYNRYPDRIVPQEILSPGDIFGLSRPLDNINPFAKKLVSPFFNSEIRAGIRSLAMAAKINDARQHDRLQLSTEKPTSYYDHWKVFREIAIKYDSDWRLEILVFSNSWFESLKEESWAALLAYLSQMRVKSNIWHNIQAWFSNLDDVESSHHLKKYPAYARDIAKHLLAIAANSAPAFKPAIDESGAPIKLIQRAYIEKYKLDYAPIIMEIAKFTKENQPLYYVLNHPTAPQTSLESSHITIVILLSYVEELINRFQQGILQDKENNITFQALYQTALDVAFSCFHNSSDNYPNISKLGVLVKEDARFMSGLTGEFPEHSPFLNGCIKIAVRK